MSNLVNPVKGPVPIGQLPMINMIIRIIMILIAPSFNAKVHFHRIDRIYTMI